MLILVELVAGKSGGRLFREGVELNNGYKTIPIHSIFSYSNRFIFRLRAPRALKTRDPPFFAPFSLGSALRNYNRAGYCWRMRVNFLNYNFWVDFPGWVDSEGGFKALLYQFECPRKVRKFFGRKYFSFRTP